MVTKVKKSATKQTASEAPSAAAHIADSIRDSAQQIWQAGLGAFAKAQEGRGKVFDALVQEGLSMQRKTQAAAEERIHAATSKVSDMASDISAKASGQWDKLEGIFEERVAKALKRLGVPTAQELAEIRAQLDALAANVGNAPKKLVSKTKTKTKAEPKAKRVVNKPSAKSTVRI